MKKVGVYLNHQDRKGGFMATEAQIRATRKYDDANTFQFKMKLNLKTDADIKRKLDSVGNKQGYIKELIRKDIERSGL